MVKRREKEKEKGSVTVLILCFMVPLIIFVLDIIFMCRYMVLRSFRDDAVILTNNALMSSYNHSIENAYGLYAFTKSESELNGIAESSMKGSDGGNATGNIHASFVKATNNVTVEKKTASDYRYSFDKQVTAFMFDKAEMCRTWTDSGLDNLETIVSYSGPMINMLREDKEILLECEREEERASQEAATETEENPEEPSEQEVPQVDTNYNETLEKKRNIYSGGGISYISLTGEAVNVTSMSPTSPGVEDICKYLSEDTEVLENATNALEEMKSYFSYMYFIKYAYSNHNNNLYAGLYSKELFSSYARWGDSSATGNKYSTGDMVSVNKWGETEYIIFGDGNIRNSWNTAKKMMFDVLFMNHLYNLIYNQPQNATLYSYAVTLSRGNEAKVKPIYDCLLVGTAAKLARADARECYRLNSVNITPGFSEAAYGAYPSFLELFAVRETVNNRYLIYDRILNTIQLNASVSSAEAREFKKSSLGTALRINNKSIAEIDVNKKYSVGFTFREESYMMFVNGLDLN